MIRDYKQKIDQKLQQLIPSLPMAKQIIIALILLIVVFVNCDIIGKSNLQIDNSEKQASPTFGSNIRLVDPVLEKIIQTYLESKSNVQITYSPPDQNSTLGDIFKKYNSTNPYKGQSTTTNTTTNPFPDQNTTLQDIFKQYNSTNPYKGQSGSTNPTPDQNTTLQDIFKQYNSTNPYKGQSGSTNPFPDQNTTLLDIFKQYNSTNPYKPKTTNSKISTQQLSPSNLISDELLPYLSNPNVKSQKIDEDTPLNQEEALILVQLLKRSGLKIATI